MARRGSHAVGPGASAGLRYFVERARPDFAFQVVLRETRERRLPDIGPTHVQVVSATRFLANLP